MVVQPSEQCHIQPVTRASFEDSSIKAVLGPTNTGKTHLAIERMCAHSSGVIGLPLRLLAREVYDRVVAIKGEKQVALITGEERIEPPNARYFCCTAEAMPRDGGGRSFVALDEAQLGANRERGHIFTDRLLHARGRDETMLLGAATLGPVVRALIPDAEIIQRPRFSTLTHIRPCKLSRLPPRSAIVGFSAEQVYAVAEMLRRFRGGSAVVMGALSPETRNRQVELFQSGEVDYIVATDAIGMGLNLDITHVAFASLTKFDGLRHRRLTPAEMAQIAGRAGRHQQDGTFSVLAGQIGRSRTISPPDTAPTEFTKEEIYAVEEHSFAPISKLFWRDAKPRFDTLSTLIGDLESPPDDPALTLAPEAIDLAVLKRLSDEPWAQSIKGAGQIRRFWAACSLPDFRQQGADTHARFIARLWQDLQGGYLGADYVAARISELDNIQGDIHTVQGRIAAIRSWAYICQRPDWVLARDEMAARARAVEARLSDALHSRLTERFVNRRTAILMKSMGQDASLLPVSLSEDRILLVEDEPIGTIEGFRFLIDHQANHADRKLLLAAGEKAMPRILCARADTLIETGLAGVTLGAGGIWWEGQQIAALEAGSSIAAPRLMPARELDLLPGAAKTKLVSALQQWLDARVTPLAPLAKLEAASRDPDAGSQARALLLALIAGHGHISREDGGLDHLPKESRPFLRRLGVTFGALDIFAPALLKPAARKLLHVLGADPRPLQDAMQPVISPIDGAVGQLPSGYRRAGNQAVRVDMAEKILRAAHDMRSKSAKRKFTFNPALAISTGLSLDNYLRLMGAAGFRRTPARALAKGALGPPAPDHWDWRPSPRNPNARAKTGNSAHPHRKNGRQKTPSQRAGSAPEEQSANIAADKSTQGPAQNTAQNTAPAPTQARARGQKRGTGQRSDQQTRAGNAFAGLADLLR